MSHHITSLTFVTKGKESSRKVKEVRLFKRRSDKTLRLPVTLDRRLLLLYWMVKVHETGVCKSIKILGVVDRRHTETKNTWFSSLEKKWDKSLLV